jgi:hypothetical protein
MAIGNALLMLIGVQILQSDRRFSGLDVAYLLVVLLIVGARLADIRYFAGADQFGKPSTLADGRRYALKVVSLAGFVWLAVHLVIQIVR